MDLTQINCASLEALAASRWVTRSKDGTGAKFDYEGNKWRLCRHCFPLPGDDLVGVSRTSDKSIEVHQRGCTCLRRGERLVEGVNLEAMLLPPQDEHGLPSEIEVRGSLTSSDRLATAYYVMSTAHQFLSTNVGVAQLKQKFWCEGRNNNFQSTLGNEPGSLVSLVSSLCHHL